MNEQLAQLPPLLAAHLELALSALLLGALCSIPLGIALARRPRAQGVVLGIAGVVQTVPSLALLAIMVPGLALLSHLSQRFLHLPIASIGYLPALLALVLYSMFPLLRNTVTGLAGVDRALVQAARGVGMTPRQSLWRVELPQALPVIVAGVRTAMVWVVGMTVLSTPVGAASLGNYIFSGLQTRNYAAVSVGCIAAAGLSLVLDLLIRSLEIGLQQGRRWHFRLAGACLLALYGFVGVATVRRLLPQDPTLRIGAKTFTEQYILAEVLAAQLRLKLHRNVEIVPSLGSTMAYEALKSGAIDAYVDYTGALWTTAMGQRQAAPERAGLLHAVQDFVSRDAHGSVAAELGFSNTYALAMPCATMRARNIFNVAQLAAAAPQRIAGDYEIFARHEFKALRHAYRLRFAQQRSMDPSLMYRALKEGEVDVITAYSSDGQLQADDVCLLADTHHSLPAYDAVILAGAKLQGDPQALAALRGLQAAIGLEQMQGLNLAVDARLRSPREVGQGFVGDLNERR